VVFLAGEAGIGKSRLAAELAADARARGVRVLTGRAVPTSTASPYRPLTEALLQALRELAFPADDGLAPWRPALRAILPAIAVDEGDGHGDHSPAVRGEAVLQLLRRLAGPAGLLLVLEDLHWADPDTLAVLEYLSDNLSAEPVLCVATCRDEPATAAAELMARLHGRRAAARIALGRLSAGQVAAMVRACLPTASEDIVARVQRLADGVPFLVEESLAVPGVPGRRAPPGGHGHLQQGDRGPVAPVAAHRGKARGKPAPHHRGAIPYPARGHRGAGVGLSVPSRTH
jgi:predicted ATPase